MNKIFFSDNTKRKSELLDKLKKKEQIKRVKHDSFPSIDIPENNSQNAYTHPALEDVKYYKQLVSPEPLNDYRTNELFNKMKIEEFNCFFYTVVSILCCIIYHEYKNYKQDTTTYENDIVLYENYLNLLLSLISISVVLFIISSIFRYLILLDLNKANHEICISTTVFNKNFSIPLIAEIFIAILHPNILLEDKSFETDETWYLVKVPYYANDYLVLIQLMRIYIVFRYLIIQTSYYSARTWRIAKMFGNNLDRIYAIKCLLSVNPLMFLIVCSSVLIIIIAVMIKVIEGPVYAVRQISVDTKNDMRYFENTVWYLFATMTTVGYGDYYAVTNLGRLVTIIATIFGAILISLIVIALQNALTLSDTETRAYEDKEKFDNKKKLEDAAAHYCKNSFNFTRILSKYLSAVEAGSYKAPKLKKELERNILNRINNKKKFKLLKQQYRNRFEVFNDNEVLKEKIEDLQVIAGNESVKFNSIYDDILSLKELLKKVEVRLQLKEDLNSEFSFSV